MITFIFIIAQFFGQLIISKNLLTPLFTVCYSLLASFHLNFTTFSKFVNIPTIWASTIIYFTSSIIDYLMPKFSQFPNAITIIILITIQIIAFVAQNALGELLKMRVELSDNPAQSQLKVDALIHYWDDLYDQRVEHRRKLTEKNIEQGTNFSVWLRQWPWKHTEHIFIYFIVFSSEDRQPSPAWYKNPFDGNSLIRQIELQIHRPDFSKTYVFKLGTALTQDMLLQGKISLLSYEKYQKGNLYAYVSAGIREPGAGSSATTRIPMGQALVQRMNNNSKLKESGKQNPNQNQNIIIRTNTKGRSISPFRSQEKQPGLLKLLITKENHLYFELPIEFEKIYGHILDYFEFHLYHVDAAIKRYIKRAKNSPRLPYPEECERCQQKFEMGEQITQLHLDELNNETHVFHRKCIEKWFESGAFERYCLSCPAPACGKEYKWSKENIFRAQPIVSQNAPDSFSHELFSNARAELSRLANDCKSAKKDFKRRQSELAIKVMESRIGEDQRRIVANLKAMGIRKNHGDPEALFIEAGRVLDTEWIRGEVAKLARDKDVEMAIVVIEQVEMVEDRLEGYARQALESMGIVEEEGTDTEANQQKNPGSGFGTSLSGCY